MPEQEVTQAAAADPSLEANPWALASQYLCEVTQHSSGPLPPIEQMQLRDQLGDLIRNLPPDRTSTLEVMRTLAGILNRVEQRNRMAVESLLEHLRQLCALPATAQGGGESLAAWVAQLHTAEANRQRQVDELCQKLHTQLKQIEIAAEDHSAAAETDNDPVTGLPGRNSAQAALRQALLAGRPAFAVAIWVERMRLTQDRFGKKVCDQVMSICCQHLTVRLLHADDSLFCWKGPGLLALLDREEQAAGVSTELQRTVSVPLNQYFETASRSVYLPIRLTAELVPLEGANDRDVISRIDQFFAGRL